MMVVICFPSRSDRRIEPSLALRLPILVQYRCPAAASMANPSGSFLPSSTMTFKSEPSGFTDITRPAATSRKKQRPDAALSRRGRSAADLLMLELLRFVIGRACRNYGHRREISLSPEWGSTVRHLRCKRQLTDITVAFPS